MEFLEGDPVNGYTPPEEGKKCHICDEEDVELFECKICQELYCSDCSAEFTYHNQLDFDCCENCADRQIYND